MEFQNKNNLCVGIIMDGNRRWAKEQGKPAVFGHRAGYEKLKEVVGWAHEEGVSHLTAYAFSTENWKRSEEEVGGLMGLFRTALSSDDLFKNENVRVSFIGERDRFDEDLQRALEQVEEKTKEHAGVHVVIALSYGGRAEIISAIQKMSNEARAGITEESFSEHLWTAGIPDPDIIIRTGGRHRLSNFLPWQSVYSELFFVDIFWPAFAKDEFSAILAEYEARDRRRGK